MESTFPLYHNLLIKSESYNNKKGNCPDLSKEQKEFFVSSVKKVDFKTQELIYALIAAFSPTDGATAVPFNGSFVDSGKVQFNFNSLPRRLKRNLYDFMTMHVNVHSNNE
jgi:hypothetical protein